MQGEPRDHTPAAERWLEATLFASRWLMAPFYLGLVLALAALLVVFAGEHILNMTPEGAILMGLSLIDLSLAGNLLLIVIFSGYENFVSKLDVGDRNERPVWMGTVDFTALKLKLISSIVAISAISLLRSFLKIGDGPLDEAALKWRVPQALRRSSPELASVQHQQSQA